jgi:outer membrane protein W
MGMAATRSQLAASGRTVSGRNFHFAAAFCGALALAAPAHAGNYFGARPYVRLGLGQSIYFSNESAPGINLLSPSAQEIVDLTFGADLSKYWGVEFDVDYNKTDIRSTSQGTLGDFSTLSAAALLRLRYPLLNGKFVPYGVFGGGFGLSDFSGRKNFTFPIGGRDSAPMAVIGGGAEYFIAHNMAAGLDLRDFFLYRPKLTINGQDQSLNADSLGIMASLRIYFDGPNSGPRPAAGVAPAVLPPAKDSDKFRMYVNVRGGKGVFTSTDNAKSLNVVMDSGSGPLLSAGLGANFSRYWGAELAMEYTRAQLRDNTGMKITGYPIWTMLALARLRYPVMEDRLVPYVIFGGGAGWSETGDRDVPQTQFDFTSSQQKHFVGAAGVGVDYFLQDNVALTFETRDTFGFKTDIAVNGVPGKLDPSFVSFTGGLRIFFN